MYDFLFVTIELFFASSYCRDVTGGNLSTQAIFEGGGSLRSPILGGGDVDHQPLLGGGKLEGLPFVWCKNIAGRFFGLVTKQACDGRTDRITTPKTALA